MEPLHLPIMSSEEASPLTYVDLYEIVRRHARARMGRQNDRLDDVVQDVVLKVWKRIRKVNSEAAGDWKEGRISMPDATTVHLNCSALLVRSMVRNSFIDMYRKEKRWHDFRSIYSASSNVGSMADPTLTPAQEPDLYLMTYRILSHLLPGKSRQHQVLGPLFAGDSCRRIARRLNLSVTTIVSDRDQIFQLMRSYLSLREQLDGRVKDILDLAAEGRSRKEIAQRLGISESTITRDMEALRARLKNPTNEPDGSGGGMKSRKRLERGDSQMGEGRPENVNISTRPGDKGARMMACLLSLPAFQEVDWATRLLRDKMPDGSVRAVANLLLDLPAFQSGMVEDRRSCREETTWPHEMEHFSANRHLNSPISQSVMREARRSHCVEVIDDEICRVSDDKPSLFNERRSVDLGQRKHKAYLQSLPRNPSLALPVRANGASFLAGSRLEEHRSGLWESVRAKVASSLAGGIGRPEFDWTVPPKLFQTVQIVTESRHSRDLWLGSRELKKLSTHPQCQISLLASESEGAVPVIPGSSIRGRLREWWHQMRQPQMSETSMGLDLWSDCLATQTRRSTYSAASSPKDSKVVSNPVGNGICSRLPRLPILPLNEPLCLSDLVKQLALLHGHRGGPDSRKELYEQAVDLLLERWEKTNKPDLDRSRALQDWLSQAPSHLNDLKRALSRLAFDAHKRGCETAQRNEKAQPVTADIAEGEVSLELAKLHPKKELVWVARGLELLKERAGLLVEGQPGVYHFSHRSFQEYLAARHLGGQADYIKQAQALARQGSYWWEALRLSAARLVQVEVGYQALGLIAALSPAREPSKGNTVAWRQIWLAGDLLKGIRRYAENEPLGKELLERTRTHLARLLELGELSPRERHEAGLILGHLDAPRQDMEKPENWIEIPPGEFVMGDDEGGSEVNLAHKVRFAQGFWVSKYPVTNQDFAAFIRAGGYQTEAWWTKDGWAFCQGEKWDAPRLCTDEQWNVPIQPVVGVSWYEADSFCRWLNSERKRLPQALLTGEKSCVIRLPSEAEWEHMARGQEDRCYPWGDNGPTPELADIDDTGLGQTSAVGAFPKGATPEGVLDSAGNVWEWCADPWHENYQGAPDDGKPWMQNPTVPNLYDGKDPLKIRVVRGGGWYYGADGVRSACRFGWLTWIRDQNRGFRVLAVVLPPDDPRLLET